MLGLRAVAVAVACLACGASGFAVGRTGTHLPAGVRATAATCPRPRAGLALRASAIKYGEMQHAGVLVQDVQKAVEFYTKVLGMQDETHLRPNLPYDGAFIGCGINQIHLMRLPSPDPTDGRPEHGGRDRHVAVTVQNIDPLVTSLEQHAVPFTLSKSGRRAVFCRDLDANAIEFVEDTSV